MTEPAVHCVIARRAAAKQFRRPELDCFATACNEAGLRLILRLEVLIPPLIEMLIHVVADKRLVIAVAA
jgi:hypothetical protein